MEKELKKGTIRNSTLKIDGKIIDINADIADQLATVAEGKRDVRAFIISGANPELTPFETQQILRELEDEGLVEPVDLTTSRRDVTQPVGINPAINTLVS